MEAVGFINNPPAGINVYEIPLPEGINISRTTKDLKLLEQVYMAGQRAGNDFIKNLRIKLNKNFYEEIYYGHSRCKKHFHSRGREHGASTDISLCD
jgi:hypothetical protein